MGRAILRALLLAAAIAACAAQPAPAATLCPVPTNPLLLAAGRQIPNPITCTDLAQSAVYEYWTPPINQGGGNTFDPAAAPPTNPAVAITAAPQSTPFLTSGAVATTVGNLPEFGPYPNVGTFTVGVRSCATTQVLANGITGWFFPATALYQTWWDTTAATIVTAASTPGLCCQACSGDSRCKAWRFTAVATVALAPAPNPAWRVCQLFDQIESARNVTVTDITEFGYSAGWGTLRVALSALPPATLLPPNLGSLATAFNTVSYGRICTGGAPNPVAIGPVASSSNFNFTAIVNAPTAAIPTLTPANVCGNATTINGTFLYTGANTAGTTNFTVTVDGAICTPGASGVAGNSVGTTVSYSCTGLTPLLVGTHNVSITAVYGSAAAGRCVGGSTIASNNFTAQAPAIPTLAASGPVPPVCAGSQAIIATFAYVPGAGVASTTFLQPTITPGNAVCIVSPPTATTNTSVTVICTSTTAFPASTQTIGLTASYTGVAPCNTAIQTVSASTNVTVAAGSSGVALTPIATPSVCSPVNSVGATWTYTATNVNTTTLTATSPGLTCSPTPATVPGSTGAIQPVNVSVTCTNALGALVPAGSVPISLSASYTGNGPCPPGTVNGTSTVTVLPQPTGSLAPRPTSSPVRTCFGSRAFGATFAATLANGATSWTATSATLANLFTCSVTQTGSASGETAAVTCNTTSPGFPTGTHTLQVQGTFAASAPCSGGPLTNGTTQVIVAAAPVVTVTPRPIAVPGCNGAASVFADFDYSITGAGATPSLLNISVPAGCTFPVPTGGTTGTIRVTCTGPFTADVPISLTIIATENADFCGSASGAGSTTVPILCCSPAGTTTYAKLNNSDYNPPQCWRHQKPGNSQWNSCPFAYGWMNQGLTDDNVPSTVEAVDAADPTCSSAGAIGTVTAKCVTLDGITGVGANGRAGNLLRITVSNFFFSSVPTMRVYAMCQPPRNRTCYASSGSLWRNPFTWPRYRPVTRDVVDAGGETKTTTFTIPMATYFAAPSGGCTCDNIYWFIEQVGQYRYRPAAGATCPWTLS